jgi:GNAT superfamily N-acetyltransferase
VVRVHVGAWDAVKEGLDLLTRRTAEDREDLWTRFLAQDRGALWVCEDDGRVVGFMAIGPSRDEDRQGEVELYTLYVDPHLWGAGIGSALMAMVPSDADVSLWVSKGNARARSFYERHGFDPDGAAESGHHVPVIRLARTNGSGPAQSSQRPQPLASPISARHTAHTDA